MSIPCLTHPRDTHTSVSLATKCCGHISLQFVYCFKLSQLRFACGQRLTLKCFILLSVGYLLYWCLQFHSNRWGIMLSTRPGLCFSFPWKEKERDTCMEYPLPIKRFAESNPARGEGQCDSPSTLRRSLFLTNSCPSCLYGRSLSP